jgi:hypothetical protein
MSSKAHAERLAKALESTGLCQAVRIEHTHQQVRLLLRIAAGGESSWTQLIERVLTAGEYIEKHAHAYQAHVCKNYFRKEMPDGAKKLVFGWYISIQSNSMSESLDVVVRAAKGSLPEAPEEIKETEEMPLGTRARELNMPTEKGRGAHTIAGKKDFKVLR